MGTNHITRFWVSSVVLCLVVWYGSAIDLTTGGAFEQQWETFDSLFGDLPLRDSLKHVNDFLLNCPNETPDLPSLEQATCTVTSLSSVSLEFKVPGTPHSQSQAFIQFSILLHDAGGNFAEVNLQFCTSGAGKPFWRTIAQYFSESGASNSSQPLFVSSGHLLRADLNATDDGTWTLTVLNIAHNTNTSLLVSDATFSPVELEIVMYSNVGPCTELPTTNITFSNIHLIEDGVKTMPSWQVFESTVIACNFTVIISPDNSDVEMTWYTDATSSDSGAHSTASNVGGTSYISGPETTYGINVL